MSTDGGRRVVRVGSFVEGRYRLLARLHRSNVYDVFDTWDDVRRTRCVIKTLRPDRRDDALATRRLVLEGRRLQRFSHPHIVRAFEVRRDPFPFVVLDTLTGQTLGHLIDTAARPATVRDTAWLGLHIGSAIGYLHHQGLLHLDLKPSNIVAERERAVLIDLSVSRAPGRMRPGIGTWCYMAPEQARGGEVGESADIWGIGVVLHEVLTGDAAFPDEGSGTPQLLRAAPSVRRTRRLAGPLPALVDACLAPRPGDRPTLDELVSGLACAAGCGLPGLRVSRSRSRATARVS